MLRRLRPRLTYANVVATLALFAALGGGAYAAGLAKNSVKSKTVKDGSIKGIDVQDDGLTGADIAEETLATPGLADGSVTGGKLAPNAVTADKVADRSLDGADLKKETEISLRGQFERSAGLAGHEIWVGNDIAETKMNPYEFTSGGEAGDAKLSASDGLETGELDPSDLPPANSGRLYFRENSGGDNRTELVVQFADGDIDVMEIDAP